MCTTRKLVAGGHFAGIVACFFCHLLVVTLSIDKSRRGLSKKLNQTIDELIQI